MKLWSQMLILCEFGGIGAKYKLSGNRDLRLNLKEGNSPKKPSTPEHTNGNIFLLKGRDVESSHYNILQCWFPWRKVHTSK